MVQATARERERGNSQIQQKVVVMVSFNRLERRYDALL